MEEKLYIFEKFHVVTIFVVPRSISSQLSLPTSFSSFLDLDGRLIGWVEETSTGETAVLRNNGGPPNFFAPRLRRDALVLLLELEGSGIEIDLDV